MRYITIYVAIASLCLAHAQDTTYQVIYSLKHDVNRQHGSKLGVRMQGNDKIYMLDNTKSLDPLVHVGTAPSSSAYQFVLLDEHDTLMEAEPFYRSPLTTSVLYDFYGRIKTIQGEPDLIPRVRYQNGKEDRVYPKGLDRSQNHLMTEIPTLHIQSPDYHQLLDRVLEDVRITVNLTRITSSSLKTYRNVNLELSGQTSRLFKKLSYSVLIDKNEKESLNGYRKFKLRACATDPSYLREKIFYDILEASDVPAAKASYIRLFINEEPQGLFLFVDNYKNPFFKNVLGNNGSKYENGALFQGSLQENPLAVGRLQSGANLAYLGSKPTDYLEPTTNRSSYSVLEDAGKGKIKDDLKELVKFIEFIHKAETSNYDKKNTQKKLTRKWERKFDVSLFLKHMAFEILLGHNDGYMGAAHNYMLYHDPDQKGRFIWIASDLDQTLGSTLMSPRLSSTGSKFDKLDRYGLLEKSDVRPLVKQLLKIDAFRHRFYQIFKDIHDSLFNSGAIATHLAQMKEFIKEDVAWDKTCDLTRSDLFIKNRTEYDRQVNEKVLQLPLGPDFWSRINKVEFHAAIDGPLQKNPSLVPLADWFKETGQSLKEFVSSLEFKQLTQK